jgi:hypothetical protein
MNYIYKIYYTIDILYRYHLHKVEKNQDIHKSDIENWKIERLCYERRLHLLFDLIKEYVVRYVNPRELIIETSRYNEDDGLHLFMKMIIENYMNPPSELKISSKTLIFYMIRDRKDKKKYYHIGSICDIDGEKNEELISKLNEKRKIE